MKKLLALVLIAVMLCGTLTFCACDRFEHAKIEDFAWNDAPMFEAELVYNHNSFFSPKIYYNATREQVENYAQTFLSFMREKHSGYFGYISEEIENNHFGMHYLYEVVPSENIDDYKYESDGYLSYGFVYSKNNDEESSATYHVPYVLSQSKHYSISYYEQPKKLEESKNAKTYNCVIYYERNLAMADYSIRRFAWNDAPHFNGTAVGENTDYLNCRFYTTLGDVESYAQTFFDFLQTKHTDYFGVCGKKIDNASIFMLTKSQNLQDYRTEYEQGGEQFVSYKFVYSKANNTELSESTNRITDDFSQTYKDVTTTADVLSEGLCYTITFCLTPQTLGESLTYNCTIHLNLDSKYTFDEVTQTIE